MCLVPSSSLSRRAKGGPRCARLNSSRQGLISVFPPTSILFPPPRRPRTMSTALPAPTPPPWKPSRYLEPTHPPPDETIKREQYEAALAASALWNGGVDFAGRPPKLLKPRRTVDYAAGVARYQTVRSTRVSTEGKMVLISG